MNIDRTISFRQDMIDLILAGKKTVTIRPIKPQPKRVGTFGKESLFDRCYWEWNGYDVYELGSEWFLRQYPHGMICDTMSIRERPEVKLKITGITVDWLHEISHDTWEKDGVSRHYVMGGPDLSYYHWQRFYAGTEYDWVKNPWVWIIEFELIEEKGQEDE
ncbi:MAG: ASCH domain-containing protein [Lentisphaeria bacterium]